jgi:hypothetical protein
MTVTDPTQSIHNTIPTNTGSVQDTTLQYTSVVHEFTIIGVCYSFNAVPQVANSLVIGGVACTLIDSLGFSSSGDVWVQQWLGVNIPTGVQTLTLSGWNVLASYNMISIQTISAYSGRQDVTDFLNFSNSPGTNQTFVGTGANSMPTKQPGLVVWTWGHAQGPKATVTCPNGTAVGTLINTANGTFGTGYVYSATKLAVTPTGNWTTGDMSDQAITAFNLQSELSSLDATDNIGKSIPVKYR